MAYTQRRVTKKAHLKGKHNRIAFIYAHVIRSQRLLPTTKASNQIPNQASCYPLNMQFKGHENTSSWVSLVCAFYLNYGNVIWTPQLPQANEREVTQLEMKIRNILGKHNPTVQHGRRNKKSHGKKRLQLMKQGLILHSSVTDHINIA